MTDPLEADCFQDIDKPGATWLRIPGAPIVSTGVLMPGACDLLACAPIGPNDFGLDAPHRSIDVMVAAGPSGVRTPSVCRNDPRPQLSTVRATGA